MANHPSAVKRARQSELRRSRNRDEKSAMRSAVKCVDTAIAAGDDKQAREALSKAISLIDRAGQSGVIHKRQASRRVSRIVARVKGVAA